MPETIYYVTSNIGKFEEVQKFFARIHAGLNIERIDYDLDEPQTLDHKAVALAKAQQAWALFKKPVLIDDAGIYFEKYNHFPGTLSKFVYQGLGFDGLFKLVQPGDRAYFLLYLVYCDGQETCTIFEARTYGTIVHPLLANNAPTLPYLSMVVPDGATKTMADLRAAGHDEPYNFRITALKKFLGWYGKQEELHGVQSRVAQKIT